jgi:hypothetical protein
VSLYSSVLVGQGECHITVACVRDGECHFTVALMLDRVSVTLQ